MHAWALGASGSGESGRGVRAWGFSPLAPHLGGTGAPGPRPLAVEAGGRCRATGVRAGRWLGGAATHSLCSAPTRLQELLRPAAAPLHQHMDPEYQRAHRCRGGAAHPTHGVGPEGWGPGWGPGWSLEALYLGLVPVDLSHLFSLS